MIPLRLRKPSEAFFTPFDAIIILNFEISNYLINFEALTFQINKITVTMKLKQSFLATAILSLLMFSMTGCFGGGDKLDVELIPVKTSKDANWSMVSSDGTIVYDSEFKNDVYACVNGVFCAENSNGGYTLYTAGDKSPEEVPGCDSLLYVGIMNDGLIPVTFPDSRITLINNKGEKEVELTPKENMEIVASHTCFQSGLLAVQFENQKWGFVNTKGELVIKPKYSNVQCFVDGYAVTAADEGDFNSNSEVIGTNGETLFKIKDKYKVETAFIKNHMVVKDEDGRFSVLDEKGEATKLPDRIDKVLTFNGNYIIFESDDRQMGVMDIKGETLIRAKYYGLAFASEDTFWAKKTNDSDIIKLDDKGETILTLNYKEMSTATPDFGLFAKDGNTFVLIDGDGEIQGKEDFYRFCDQLSPSQEIKSDYFDFSGTISRIAEMISDNGACGLTFGQTPDKIFHDETPIYTDNNIKAINSKITGNSSGEIIPLACFSTYPTMPDGSGYAWNTEAKLTAVQIDVTATRNLKKENYDSLVKAIGAKGFKSVKNEMIPDTEIMATLMEKGNEAVLVQFQEDGNSIVVYVISKTLAPLAMETLEGMFADNTNPVKAEADSGSDYRAMVTGRKLTAQDLAPYSKAELRLMRNTIFAIHGHKFQSEDLQQYFSQFPWYRPTVTEVPEDELSEIEKYNVTFLQKYE